MKRYIKPIATSLELTAQTLLCGSNGPQFNLQRSVDEGDARERSMDFDWK